MKALVGFSGTVGQNLMSQISFDRFYNSQNINEIQGQTFDELYLSCLPATKWHINLNPEADHINTQNLISILSTVRASFVVLISTIDVYGLKDAVLTEVDEPNPSDTYGSNRLVFESFVSKHFASRLIVRLPGLFGAYLKKNIIYDLLTDNSVDKINQNSSFQWYHLDNLHKDIQIFRRLSKPVVNFFTEPIETIDIVRIFFPTTEHLLNKTAPSVSYNLRTRYAVNGYLYSKDQVLSHLASFIKQYQTDWKGIVVSNLAWDLALTDKVVDVLKSSGMSRVELALSKYANWSDLSEPKIREIRAYFDAKGIEVYSLQALTFGLDYNLFDETWTDLLIHLQRVLSWAAILGCSVVVFGSPKNRSIPPDSAFSEARVKDFFCLLNQAAKDHNICVCIEPNARVYSCNFLWNLEDTYFFVKKLNLSHIKMMADTGCMSLESDSIKNIVLYQSEIRHIHLSEPYLKQLTNEHTNHIQLSRILNKCQIKTVSIEMVADKRSECQLNQLYQTIHFVKTNYRDLWE